MSGHPPWCSPQHCFLDEDGVWVHEQEPVRWEECEVRFESRLLFTDGEHPPTTYLQLSIENLRLTWRFVDAFLPIATARRLRDQLTAHLDAADTARAHGRRPPKGISLKAYSSREPRLSAATRDPLLPMRWASERRWQLCVGIALRRIELGLDEKDTVGEVGASEVSISEVSPGKVGHSQVGAFEVTSDEVCPSQVGASQISTFEVGPDEVGSSAVLLALGFGSHEFARA